MPSELRFAGGATSALIVVKRSARAKGMRLRVDPRTGGVALTLPRRASERHGLAWAAGKRAWIEEMLARIPAPTPLAAGNAVPLYGRPHDIVWSAGRGRIVEVESDQILIGGPAETIAPRIARWLKRHAHDVLAAETRYYAAKAGVAVARIGIGDPVARWGSCSASGAIRYSWRLILAPDWVRRATVAHEVAHRVHMNHGPDFHALVASLLEADPRPARLWLRRHGAGLHRIAV